MAHLALGIAIAFACFGLGTDAKPLEHSRNLSGRRSLDQRDETPAYSPIAPSVLADVEFRPSTTSPSVGDYVATGLGAEMDLVAQEYGLKNSESFYWGLDGMPLANLTAFAEGEDVRVLSVERFAGVLDSAQCSNTSVKLTFTQEADFQDILSAWTWINDADENYVVLVTETSQCNAPDGDNTDRQPWHVTHATFDDTSNTVSLDAVPKTWDEAFGSWHLTVDSRGVAPSQQPSRRSDLYPRESSSATLPLAWDISGKQASTTEGSSITCTTCSLAGELDFRIDVDFSWDDGLTGNFSITPLNVGAVIDLDFDLKQGVLQDAFTIATFKPPVGTAGHISIPKIVDLTPQLSFGVAGDVKLSNDVTILTELDMNVSNSAVASFDFGSLSPSYSGWTPTTSFDTDISDTVEVNGFFAPQIKIAYVGNVADEFSGEIGLLLLAPELIFNASIFEKDQASTYSCPTPASDEGVYLELGLGLDFDSYETLDVPFHDIGATQTLYAYADPTPFFSTCFGSLAPEATKNGGPGPVGPTYPLPTGTNGTIAPGYAPYGSPPCSVHGQLICNGENYFALCNWGTAIWQPVAEGTACENGAIKGTGIYANPPVYSSDSVSATCSINGQLLCNGDSQFGLCNWGRVVWQPVAAGTQCQSGQIVRRGVYASPTPTPMLGLIRGR